MRNLWILFCLLPAILFAQLDEPAIIAATQAPTPEQPGTPVDLLIIPSGTAGTLLTYSAVSNFTLGPGSWSYIDHPTTHTLLTNAVYTRRTPFNFGGVLYSNNTHAILFNMDTNLTPSGANEGFQWQPTGLPLIYGASVCMTFKFVVGNSAHNFDQLMLQSTNYAIAQLQVAAGTYQIVAHSEPQTAGIINGFTTNHYYNLHLRMNVEHQKVEIVMIDTVTGAIIGSASKFITTDQGYGHLSYYNMQDYLWNTVDPAQLEISMVAMDWTNKRFPLEPVSVNTPTNLLVTQITNNTLRFTWTSAGISEILERNTNSTGWVTITNDYNTASIYEDGRQYIDTNVVAGASYQYRVTSQVGDYQSASASSVAYTITNSYSGFDAVWQQETNEYTIFAINTQYHPLGQMMIGQYVKGIHTSPMQISKVAINLQDINGLTTQRDEVLQISISSGTNRTGILYGTSRGVVITNVTGWREFTFFSPVIIPAGSNFWIGVEGNWVNCSPYVQIDEFGYLAGQGFDLLGLTFLGDGTPILTNKVGGNLVDMNFKVFVKHTPVPPTNNLVVTQTDTGTVRLGWQDSNTNLANYRIDQQTNGGTWNIGITNTSRGATNIYISGLVDGQTNLFRIYAYVENTTGSESSTTNFPSIKINDAPFTPPTFTDAIPSSSVDTEDSNAALWRQDIVAGNSGTCTKLRVWIQNPAAPAPLKMAIYDNAGNLLGSGTRAAHALGAPAWDEVTLDTPVSGITMGNTYKLAVISSSSGWRIGFQNGVGSAYIDFGISYASFPPSTLSAANNGSFTVAVGMGVVP